MDEILPLIPYGASDIANNLSVVYENEEWTYYHGPFPVATHAAAEKWVEDVFDYVKRLENFPESGRVVSELASRRDLRELVFKNEMKNPHPRYSLHCNLHDMVYIDILRNSVWWSEFGPPSIGFVSES